MGELGFAIPSFQDSGLGASGFRAPDSIVVGVEMLTVRSVKP